MATPKNWYAQMVKSQETARERNRREQRRLQIHLDQRSGPEFTAKYRVKELNREQRIISKELDRIRKGIHKPPAHEYAASSPVEKREVFSFSDLKSAVFYSQEETNLYRTMVFMQNNPSALVPIVDAHAQSQAYFETLQRVTPSFTPSPRELFVPNYLKRFKGTEVPEERHLNITKYSALLYRQSPVLRKNSPVIQGNTSSLKRNSPVVSVGKQIELTNVPSPLAGIQANTNKNGEPSKFKIQHDDTKDHRQSDKSVYQEQENNEKVTNHIHSERDMVDAVNENASSNETSKVTSISLDPIHTTKGNDDNYLEVLDAENNDSNSLLPTSRSSVVSAKRCKNELIPTSTPTLNRPRQPLDLLALSDNGIQSARENIAKRLTNNEMASTVNKSGVDRKSSVANNYRGVADESNDNATEDGKNKPLTATKAVAMFPSYDPEVYNADGSLRTVHQLPDFDDSYQQARKARYCRSKEHLERERELGIKEIFDKS